MVSVKGSATGTVLSSPAGINCGPTCSAVYISGSPILLTATPAVGATFKQWGGACSGTASTCTVTMDAARSVTATFSMTFTDGTGSSGTISAQSVVIKAAHIIELRSAIDKLRSVNALSAFDWTDATLTAGVTVVKRVHLTDLRTALSQAYQAAGQAAKTPSFTDSIITTGVTVIKAVHLNDLRTAVRTLE